MRTLGIILFLAWAANCFAQKFGDQTGRFYGPLVSGNWAPKSARLKILPAISLPIILEGRPPNPKCSVPLLQAQIPPDRDFTIRRMSPPVE